MSKWTQDEVDVLKENFGKKPIRIWKDLLPNRSSDAIHKKAQRVGLYSDLTVRGTSKAQPTKQLSAKDDELLAELGRRGYSSTKREVPRVDETYPFPALLEPIEIGVISDSHLGNKHQQITHLNRFYDLCYDRGIQVMLNCGDITDGNGKVYRGQSYDLHTHGSDAQVDYAADIYPKRKGMITYMIAGNHDESFYKSDGSDVVKRIAEKRDDLLYLGMYGANLKLGDIKIYMLHGAGGVAYARSYKLQKIIEQMSPQSKPHILFAGHWHVASHLPMYRNVEGFSVGCFQSQTSYLRRKGIYPTLSGLIVKIYPDEKGLQGIDTHWEYYHVPIDHDY